MKRAIDIIISAAALIVLALPFLAIWTLVKLTSSGPGLFWSQRVGMNGRLFWMPKFRTMQDGCKLVSREVACDDDVKVTPIGNFLRKTSIDELPQLWSVLKGDMSLIGPRALIPHDIAISERAKFPEIFNIRPGISGLAQIKGRNIVRPRQKALYDAFYAQRACLVFDLWIVGETVAILQNTEIIK